MPSVSFKCPNCGGPLTFDPEKQMFVCDFCVSEFDEKTLQELAAKKEAEEAAKAAEAEATGESAQEQNGETAVYTCPSCGAELVTDATTAATECYYCHNPVVLAGRLRDDMRPDFVLPFTVSKEQATEKFLAWVGKKKFVPKGFFDKKQIERLAGVYYPYWLTDCTFDASYSGEGCTVSRTSTATEDITTRKYYRITRRADISFRNVSRSALTKADRKLADGVHPYELEAKKPFSLGYLSGFLAEKRDVESADIKEDVENELKSGVQPMLLSDVRYSSLSGSTDIQVKEEKFSYGLLPSWVLTYRGKDEKTYYYALNGQTGEACGKLPIDKGKLWGRSLMIGGIVAAVLMFLGWLI